MPVTLKILFLLRLGLLLLAVIGHFNLQNQIVIVHLYFNNISYIQDLARFIITYTQQIGATLRPRQITYFAFRLVLQQRIKLVCLAVLRVAILDLGKVPDQGRAVIGNAA